MANMSKLKSDFFLLDLSSTVFPRIMRPPQHPLTAWFAAGFSTAVIAVVVFLAFSLTIDDFTGSLYKTFYVLVIFEAVHLLGHLIVGLPFFFIFWNRRDSKVWNIIYAIPLGFIFGYWAMFLIFLFESGFEVGRIDTGFLFGCLFGGAYGSVTALCSWSIFRWANTSRTLERM